MLFLREAVQFSDFVMLFSCPSHLIITYMHIDIDPLCFRLFIWICISDVIDDDLVT